MLKIKHQNVAHILNDKKSRIFSLFLLLCCRIRGIKKIELSNDKRDERPKTVNDLRFAIHDYFIVKFSCLSIDISIHLRGINFTRMIEKNAHFFGEYVNFRIFHFSFLWGLYCVDSVFSFFCCYQNSPKVSFSTFDVVPFDALHTVFVSCSSRCFWCHFRWL